MSKHLQEQVQHQKYVLGMATRKWERHCCGAVFRLWAAVVADNWQRRILSKRFAKLKQKSKRVEKRYWRRRCFMLWRIEARKKILRRRILNQYTLERLQRAMRQETNLLEVRAPKLAEIEEKSRVELLKTTLEVAMKNFLLKRATDTFRACVDAKRHSLNLHEVQVKTARALLLASVAAQVAYKVAHRAAMDALHAATTAHRLWTPATGISDILPLQRVWEAMRLPPQCREHCLQKIQIILAQCAPQLFSLFRHHALQSMGPVAAAKKSRSLLMPPLIFSLDALKAVAQDSNFQLLARAEHGFAWPELEQLFKLCAKQIPKCVARGMGLDMAGFICLLMRVAHSSLLRCAMKELQYEQLQYIISWNKRMMLMAGLNALDYGNRGRRKELQNRRVSFETDALRASSNQGLQSVQPMLNSRHGPSKTWRDADVCMPPGLLTENTYVSQGMVLAMRMLVKERIGRSTLCFLHSRHHSSTFSNLYVRRLVINFQRRLHRIFAFYCNIDASTSTGVSSRSIEGQTQIQPPGEKGGIGNADIFMSLQGLYLLLQDCSPSAPHTPKNNSWTLADVQTIFINVLRSRKNEKIRHEDAKNLRMSKHPMDLHRTAADMSPRTRGQKHPRAGNGSNISHEVGLDFQAFLEALAAASCYFVRDPFTPPSSKFHSYLKLRVLPHCRMEQPNRTPTFKENKLKILFAGAYAKEAVNQANHYVSYQKNQVRAIQLNPNMLYKPIEELDLMQAQTLRAQSLIGVGVARKLQASAHKKTSQSQPVCITPQNLQVSMPHPPGLQWEESYERLESEEYF